MTLPLPHRLTPAARGFTLIEVLVVVVILAILSSFALLNMNFDNRGKQIESLARQMAALISLASDESIYLQQELGLRFGETDFGFYRLVKPKREASQQDDQRAVTLGEEDAKPDKPSWQPVNNDPRLRSRPLPEDVEVLLEISGVEVVIEDPTDADIEAGKVKPQVLLLSNGEIMPDFSILLRDLDGDHAYTIASGVDVPVIVERVE
jgi:general secretion pathway protein H